VDLWTMRPWRTGALAVDNSGELPTAHPFAHKLHRLLQLFLKHSKYQPQVHAHARQGSNRLRRSSTPIADSWCSIACVTQATCLRCPPSSGLLSAM